MKNIFPAIIATAIIALSGPAHSQQMFMNHVGPIPVDPPHYSYTPMMPTFQSPPSAIFLHPNGMGGYQSMPYGGTPNITVLPPNAFGSTIR